MSRIYDLHSHSTVSDGGLSPEGLVRRASEKGIDVLALTDHDVTDGLPAAAEAAQQAGLHLIPGVEVSVTWNKQTVHILGLNIDAGSDSLQQGLRRLREFRQWRAGEIARQLAKAGIEGALEGARKYASGALISRTHFAHFLVEQGYAKDARQVFKKYLIRNKPGHVSGEWATLEEAVSWINTAGGQAVIAHPARYKLTSSKFRKLVEEFKHHGGEGIEVVSSSHSDADCQAMARYAEHYELLASRGSDYHGPEHPWVELGRIPALPDNCSPIWGNWSLPVQS